MSDSQTLREYLGSIYKHHTPEWLESNYQGYLNDIVDNLQSEIEQGNWLVDCPIELFAFMRRRQYDFHLSMEEANNVLDRVQSGPAKAA